MSIDRYLFEVWVRGEFLVAFETLEEALETAAEIGPEFASVYEWRPERNVRWPRYVRGALLLG